MGKSLLNLGRVPSSCLRLRVLVRCHDVDDDDAGLFTCLDVAIRVGNCLKGIPAIDDRPEFARLHPDFQEVDERLGGLREREDDLLAQGDRRPEQLGRRAIRSVC